MLAYQIEEGLGHFENIKDFEQKVLWAQNYTEFLNLNRNDVVDMIKQGLKNGWKKEIVKDPIRGIDVVKLVKGKKHASFGKLNSGEWFIHLFQPSAPRQIYHGD